MSAESNSDNKNDLKPHTNTLKTKTIRIKSWRNSLLRKRTPAVIFITIGFFITAFLPAYAIVADTSNDKPDSGNPADNPNPESADKTLNTDLTNMPDGQVESSTASEADRQSSTKSSTTVEIQSTNTGSGSSPSAGSGNSSDSSLTINGREVDLPKNGTYRETVKTEDSTTRIRARFDNESNMSLRINHSSEKEVD